MPRVQSLHTRDIIELLQESVVRVVSATASATGFFVAPNVVLTCAHVLPEEPGDAVYWRGERLPAVRRATARDLDLALLSVDVRVDPPPACVLLDDGVVLGDVLYVWGHPEGDYAANGDSATFEYEGNSVNGAGHALLKFKAGQSVPGLSGAPVLNLRTGAICGVVRTSRDTRFDLGGRAISTSTLLQAFPEVAEWQAEAHRHDGRWTWLQRLHARHAATLAEPQDGEVRSLTLTVPPAPSNFIDRTSDLEVLSNALLASTPSGRIGTTVVHGMGGVGKSVLAGALCRLPRVTAAFTDGIAWSHPDRRREDPIGAVQAVADSLGVALSVGGTVAGARAALQTALANKSVLLVLDDVVEMSEVEPFLVESARSRLLITSRDSTIAARLSAHDIPLATLTEAPARALLTLWAGGDSTLISPAALEVLRYCGGLPLAIAMCGALARGKPHRWTTIADDLRSADLAKIAIRFPDYPHPDLLRALAVSVDALPAELRQRYLSLAVLPPARSIPLLALETLWQLDARTVLESVESLAERSLVTLHGDGGFRLHDLLTQYLRRVEEASLDQAHRRVIERYANRTGGPWHLGPDDGYFFQNLPYHLASAGLHNSLRDLLLDPRWLHVKLDASTVAEVLADFSLLADRNELRLLEAAIRISADVLARDGTQLLGQLKGRLVGSPAEWCDAFLAALESTESRPAFAPVEACLTPPETPLLRKWQLAEGAEGKRVVFSADSSQALFGIGSRLFLWDCANGTGLRDWCVDGEILDVKWLHAAGIAVCATADGLVRSWDTSTGEQRRLLEAHRSLWVHPLAVSEDGRSVATGDEQGVIRLIDLETGAVIASTKAFTSWVQVLLWLEGGLIAGSTEGTLKRWNISDGACLEIGSCEGGYHSAAVSPDRRHFLTDGGEGQLQLWDALSFTLVRTMRHQQSWISALAFAPSGHRAISGHGDGAVVVWNIDEGRPLLTLAAHDGSTIGATFSPDGTRAISGGREGGLRLWTLNADSGTRTLQARGQPLTAMRPTAAGSVVMWAHHDGTVTISDECAREGELTFQGAKEWVEDVTLTPDGRYLVCATATGNVVVWDVASRQVAHTYRAQPDDVAAAVLTKDGRFAFFGDRSGVTRVWDTLAAKQVRELKGDAGVVLSLAVSDDHARALVSRSAGLAMNGVVETWDLRSGRVIASCSNYVSRGRVLLFIPGTGLAVAGTTRGQILVWDALSGSIEYALDAHENSVKQIQVSADCRRLVSCSADRTIKVWDLGSKVCLCTFTTDAQVEACVFAGNQVVVASTNRGHPFRLRLLNLRPDGPQTDNSFLTDVALGPPPSAATSATAHSRSWPDWLADVQRRAREKVGSRDRSPLDEPVDPTATAPGRRVDIPQPYDWARADDAARLNIDHQQQLREWLALPLWRRLLTKRPRPLPGN